MTNEKLKVCETCEYNSHCPYEGEEENCSIVRRAKKGDNEDENKVTNNETLRKGVL